MTTGSWRWRRDSFLQPWGLKGAPCEDHTLRRHDAFRFSRHAGILVAVHPDSAIRSKVDDLKTGADSEPRRRGFAPWSAVRANFLTGLVVVAPVGLTIYIVWTAIGIIDSWVLPFIPRRYQPETVFGADIHGFGLVIFLVFVITVGYVAKGLIGRWLLRQGESAVARMPVVRSVYRGLKQIAEAVVNQSDRTFDKVCIVEYPRKGLWAVAFYSNEARGEIRSNLGAERDGFISVFLPTTPQPDIRFPAVRAIRRCHLP